MVSTKTAKKGVLGLKKKTIETKKKSVENSDKEKEEETTTPRQTESNDDEIGLGKAATKSSKKPNGKNKQNPSSEDNGKHEANETSDEKPSSKKVNSKNDKQNPSSEDNGKHDEKKEGKQESKSEDQKKNQDTKTETETEIEVPTNAVQPDYGMTFKFIKQIIEGHINLHKVPPQFINFEPTRTHLHLDTFKFSKKYYLHVPYPEETLAIHEKAEAVFEHGILKFTIPIVPGFGGEGPFEQSKTNTKNKGQTYRKFRKNQEQAKKELQEIEQQIRTMKPKRKITEIETRKKEESENSDNQNHDDKNSENENGADNDDHHSSDDFETNEGSDDQSEKQVKKRKVFSVDKNKAKSLVDEIANAQDSKIERNLERQKVAHDERKKKTLESRGRKLKKKDLRKKVIQSLESRQKEKEDDMVYAGVKKPSQTKPKSEEKSNGKGKDKEKGKGKEDEPPKKKVRFAPSVNLKDKNKNKKRTK